MTDVVIHNDLAHALAQRRAVVALETAVTTAGLPRTPSPPPTINNPMLSSAFESWDSESPVNLETARAMSRAVQQAGATPAVVAVMNGQLRIGLDTAELETLALDHAAEKCATADLAAVIASGVSAGTTVSSTLTACSLTEPLIRVFATGGIGGVHRGWINRPDLSNDLTALANTPVCVVCSGAKSLLDLPATVEALETLGVPIIGFGTDRFPQFVAGVRDDLPLRQHTDDIENVVDICRLHWNVLHQKSAVLVVNPVDQTLSLNSADIERAVCDAESEATKQDVGGANRTPFVLDHVARVTDGRSLAANIALLLANASLAAGIAGAWSQVEN